MNRTKDQNNRLFALLGKLGIDKVGRADLVEAVSKNRTSSSAQLTYQECAELIDHLQARVSALDERADTMRKKILAMAHDMNWKLAGDHTKIDLDSVNTWCVKSGKFHKPLNDHTAAELVLLVSQFEMFYNKAKSRNV